MADPAERERYNEKHRDYRAAHRDQVNAIQKRSHEKTKTTKPELLKQKRHRRRSRESAAGGDISVGLRAAVFTQFGTSCYLCGAEATVLDHYQPLAAGGRTVLENLRPCCTGCNARKGQAWPFDADALRARILAERDVAVSTEVA